VRNVQSKALAAKAQRTGGEGQENDCDPQILSVVPQTYNPRPPDDYSIAENILKYPKSDDIIEASYKELTLMRVAALNSGDHLVTSVWTNVTLDGFTATPMNSYIRSTPSATEYAQYAAESRYMNVVIPNMTLLTRLFNFRSLSND
jgi:hypothetical protein